MRDYNRNNNQSRKPEKKKNRVKINCDDDNECKCFTPAAKLHHYGCPLVKKPCPIHGGRLCFSLKEEKTGNEVEDCVVISFHPSLKTDKLFRPVKSLLARRCSPEAKINFQYYSPRDYNKDALKNRQIQTDPEDLSRIENNYFVEKTKNFISDKTNRMKKLKQCFHSPCNSVAQKSRSHTSVTEKLNEIFREDRKKSQDISVSVENFFKERCTRDRKAEYINFDPNIGWYYCDRITSSDGEKSSLKDLSDSDFISLTQKLKNSFINPTVFRVKEKKDVNDIYKSKRKSSDSAAPVFSSIGSDNQNTDEASSLEPTKKEDLKPVKEEKKRVSLSSKSFEKTESDSSDSVYYTPFLLMSAELDSSGKPIHIREKIDKGVQWYDINGREVPLNLEKERSEEIAITPEDKPTSSQNASVLSLFKNKSTQTSESDLKTENYGKPPFQEQDTVDQRIKPEEVKKVQTSTQTSLQTSTRTSISTTTQEKNNSKSIEITIPGKETSSKYTQTNEKKFKNAEVNAILIELKLNQTSNEDLKKMIIWSKSHSDGELLETKHCDCIDLEEAVVPLHNCYCYQESISPEDKNPDTNEETNITYDVYYPESIARATDMEPEKNKVTLVDETTNTVGIITKDECVNSSFSDLSELIKIINENFGLLSKKFSNDREDKRFMDHATMTESMETIKKKDAVVQTALFQPDPLAPGRIETSCRDPLVRQSLPQDEAGRAVFLCKICAGKINITLKDAWTCTDSHPSESKKAVKTPDAGKICELTETVTITKKITKPPESGPKPIPATRKPNPKGRNKEIPKRTTPPSKPPWNSPIYVEKRVPKSECPVPAPRVNVIPVRTVASPRSTRRSVTIDAESRRPVMSPNQPGVASTKNSAKPETSIPSCVNGGVCDCPPKTDIYPSLPIKPWPGETPKPKPKQNSDRLAYPVFISPFWPKDINVALQDTQFKIEPKSSSNSTLPESARTSCKRNFEKESGTGSAFPIGKKIKSEASEKVNILQMIETPRSQVVSSSTDSKLCVKENRNNNSSKKESTASCCFFTCRRSDDKILGKKSFRLYKCEFCNSLTYLSPTKNRFQCTLMHSRLQRSLEDHATNNDALEPNTETSSDENFLAEYTLLNESNDSPRIPTENISEDEAENEDCQPNFTVLDVNETVENLLPSGLSYHLVKELASTSQALSTFWFKGTTETQTFCNEEDESELKRKEKQKKQESDTDD